MLLCCSVLHAPFDTLVYQHCPGVDTARVTDNTVLHGMFCSHFGSRPAFIFPFTVWPWICGHGAQVQVAYMLHILTGIPLQASAADNANHGRNANHCQRKCAHARACQSSVLMVGSARRSFLLTQSQTLCHSVCHHQAVLRIAGTAHSPSILLALSRPIPSGA